MHDPLRPVVLGASNAWAAPGGATSGYLVDEHDTRILVDCGHGVLARLREHLDPADLDAVWLTHLHADHCADLISLQWYLLYHPHGRPVRRVTLFVPRGEILRLRLIEEAYDEPGGLERAFDIVEVEPDQDIAVGGLVLRGALVPHPVHTLALDVRSAGRRVTFSADCGPSDELVDLARDTPLLLCEMTMPEPFDGHLTPGQAGRIAARAGVGELVGVHICDAMSEQMIRAAVSEHFQGPFHIATPTAP